MNTNPIIEKQSGELVSFPTKKEEDNVKKIPKLKKDGTEKNVPNNTKRNRDNICPINEEDIKPMVKYFKDKIDSSKNPERELVNRRNLSMFIMGINIGLRCSDLVKLKWGDVYDANWRFLDGKKITPQKTSNKNKHVVLKYNDAFKQAIEYYREYCKDITLNDYIFASMEEDSEYVCVDHVGRIIKNAAKEIGINYPVCTHSMRKTFARVRYDHAEDKNRVLVELMRIFNHANTRVTLDYIGITDNELEDLYNNVNLGLDDMFN